MENTGSKYTNELKEEQSNMEEFTIMHHERFYLSRFDSKEKNRPRLVLTFEWKLLHIIHPYTDAYKHIHTANNPDYILTGG